MAKSVAPLVAKMRNKALASKSRKRVANIPREQRRAAAQLAQEKQRELHEEIKDLWRKEDEKIEELALKHGRTVQWMRQKVQRTSKYGKEAREVNPYNAWLHCTSLEINENVPPGEKVRLTQLREMAQRYTGETYENIAEEDIEAMKNCLREYRELQTKGIRSQSISSAHDHRQTSRRIADELKNLQSRCDSTSLLISAKTTANQTYVPQYSVDQVSLDFIEICLAIPINTFMLRFEGFALSGVRGQGLNAKDRQNMWKKAVRTYVQEGLRTIARDNKATMSWENYEGKVVDKYHVVLEGWPCDTMNPAKMSLVNLEKAVDALRKDVCKWRAITEEELAERRKTVVVVEKQRKRRSDEGSTRPMYKGKKTKSAAPTDEVPSDLDDTSADEE